MGPTLKTIAAEAGVSISTASRIMRFDGSLTIPEATRSRVLDIANRLGYLSRHNVAASGNAEPSRDKNHSLVYILPEFTQEKFKDPIISEIIGGIETEIVAHGYYLGPCHNIVEFSRPEIVHRIVKQRPDGVIFMGHMPNDLYRKVCTLIPHQLSLFSNHEDPSVNCITVDYERYGYEAVKHLIQKGHTRIAFVGGGDAVSPEDNRHGLFYAHESRYKGYLQALIDHGISVDTSLVTDGAWHIEQAYSKSREMLALDHGITAFFVASDRMAIGVMRAIHEVGLRIPEDISIVGFDNIYGSGFFNPPITTVDYDKMYMGRLAVQYLVEGINGGDKPPVKTVLPCKLIERQSVGELRNSETATA
jgi:DNA-binding LacI/PurR family transcriptional regulator